LVVRLEFGVGFSPSIFIGRRVACTFPPRSSLSDLCLRPVHPFRPDLDVASPIERLVSLFFCTSHSESMSARLGTSCFVLFSRLFSLLFGSGGEHSLFLFSPHTSVVPRRFVLRSLLYYSSFPLILRFFFFAYFLPWRFFFPRCFF